MSDSPTPPPVLPGLTLERKLGAGAMGEVWRAIEVASGRAVAVKVVPRPASGEVDRWERELGALRAVEHPNLVRFFGAGEDAERRWLVLELVEGATLADLIALGALGPEGLALLLAQVARGLAALHAAGIVHRDVKPANVLVDGAFVPRLADFGLARAQDEQTRLTGTGTTVGTPYYLAPEVLQGQPAGPASDVWALGVILLEGLLGQHPLASASSWPEVARAVLDRGLPPAPASAPAHLAALVRDVVVLDPARRPTAAEVGARLAGSSPLPAVAPVSVAPIAASPLPTAGTATATLPTTEGRSLAPVAGPTPAGGRLRSVSPARLRPASPALDARATVGGSALGPGAQVGPYVLEAVVAAGTSATVFAARHATLGAERAVKVLARVHGATARERFEREGRALARVARHAGVVAVHEAGLLEDGRPWLGLELIAGGSLRDAMRAGPLPLARALRIGASLARALAHVHAHGIAHRDLKPENVVLRADGDAPVLVDFGLALDTVEDRLTASALVVGTPQYLAPEQVEARREQVGEKADLFALGLVLHEALAGEHPLRAPTVPAQLLKIARADAPPLRAARPDAPPDLEALLRAMLARDPAARPMAAVVAEALELIAAGRRWREPGSGAAPSRTAAVALACALLATAGLAALLALEDGRIAPPIVAVALDEVELARRALAAGDAAALASGRAALARALDALEPGARALPAIAATAARLDAEEALARGDVEGARRALDAAAAGPREERGDEALRARLAARRDGGPLGPALRHRADGVAAGVARAEVLADAVRAHLAAGEGERAAEALARLDAEARVAAAQGWPERARDLIAQAVARALIDAAARAARAPDARPPGAPEVARAAALVEQARSIAEPGARAALADVVARALAGTGEDPASATDLVLTLDRAWPGVLPPSAARAPGARALLRDGRGDPDGAAQDWSRAQDLDPSWPLPSAASFVLERRAREHLRAKDPAAAARVLLPLLRHGRTLWVVTTDELATLHTTWREAAPSDDRAPWARDLLRAIAAACALELRRVPRDERTAVATRALERADRAAEATGAPAASRARAADVGLQLHQLAFVPALAARAEALLARPAPKPPAWLIAWRVARGHLTALDMPVARTWTLRALDLAHAPDVHAADVEDVFGLAVDLAIQSDDAALARDVLARPRASLLAEHADLLRAIEVAATGDRARARALVTSVLERVPGDPLARSLLERLRR